MCSYAMRVELISATEKETDGSPGDITQHSRVVSIRHVPMGLATPLRQRSPRHEEILTSCVSSRSSGVATAGMNTSSPTRRARHNNQRQCGSGDLVGLTKPRCGHIVCIPPGCKRLRICIKCGHTRWVGERLALPRARCCHVLVGERISLCFHMDSVDIRCAPPGIGA